MQSIVNELSNTMPFSDELNKAVEKFYQARGKRVLYQSDVRAILHQTGWKPIGHGACSSVCENERYPYLLKLNRFQDNAFAKFAVLCRQHKDNPHFPVIGNAKPIHIGDTRYVAYMIEKLQELSDRGLAGEILRTAEKLIKNPSMSNELNLEDSLFEAIKLTVRHGLSIRAKIDLHSENVMQRSDGTVVIVDPWVFPNDLVAVKLSEEFNKPVREKAGCMPYVIENGIVKGLFVISSNPAFGGSAPMLVKGHVDSGETVAEAALREAQEEAGLKLSNIKMNTFKQGWQGQITGMTSTNPMTIFVVECKTTTDFNKPDYEISSTHWLSWDEYFNIGRASQRAVVRACFDQIEKTLA